MYRPFFFLLIATVLLSCNDDFIDNNFHSYQGVVTDTLGTPKSGITLSLYTGEQGFFINEVQTDLNGRFKMYSPGIEGANFRLIDEPGQFYVRDEPSNVFYPVDFYAPFIDNSTPNNEFILDTIYVQ